MHADHDDIVPNIIIVARTSYAGTSIYVLAALIIVPTLESLY
jgi:hypothetical protein